jgi:hypothetical protein
VLKSRWLLVGAALIVATRGLAAAVPERLTDQEFWALAESLSEPGAAFGTSENLVSNEGDVAIMAGLLKRWSVPGVLIGVGPEQNFSSSWTSDVKTVTSISCTRRCSTCRRTALNSWAGCFLGLGLRALQ